jgi:transposase
MLPRKPTDPKLKALLEQGAANPRPQDVRDPAFRESEFFDARDLVQVRYEMLRRVRSEGRSVADAAMSFGVSRPTFYKAQSDFERDGVAGLLPGKRGPQGPHKLTSDVMEFFAAELAKDPSLDAETLAERLERRRNLRVHPRTIERALSRSKKKAR